MIETRAAIAGQSPFRAGAMLLVVVNCIVQAVRDLRGRHHAMATPGFLCAALLLSVPVGPHSVKLDLPVRSE